MSAPVLRDKLTALYEKQFFEELLLKEVVRSSRYARPFSLLLIEISYDYFIKDMNLRTELGYRILKEVGCVVADLARDVDFGGRIDGEVLALALPETTREGAAVVAERLRESMAERTFLGTSHPEPRVALNIGLSSFPENGTTREELIVAAETARLEARQAGGNKVVAAKF